MRDPGVKGVEAMNLKILRKQMLVIVKFLFFALLLFVSPLHVRGSSCDSQSRYDQTRPTVQDDWTPSQNFIFVAEAYKVTGNAGYNGSEQFVLCQKLWGKPKAWKADANQHFHLSKQVEDRWGVKGEALSAGRGPASFEERPWGKLLLKAVNKLSNGQDDNNGHVKASEAARDYVNQWLEHDRLRKNTEGFGVNYADGDPPEGSDDKTKQVKILKEFSFLMNNRSLKQKFGIQPDGKSLDTNPDICKNSIAFAQAAKIKTLSTSIGAEIKTNADFCQHFSKFYPAASFAYSYMTTVYLKRFHRIYLRASKMGVNMFEQMRVCGLTHLMTTQSPEDLVSERSRTSLDNTLNCRAFSNETQDWTACNALLDAYDIGGIAEQGTQAIQNFDFQSKSIKDQEKFIGDPLNPENALQAEKSSVKRMKGYATQRAALSGGKALLLTERISAMPDRDDVRDYVVEVNGGKDVPMHFAYRNLLSFQRSLQKEARKIHCEIQSRMDKIFKNMSWLASINQNSPSGP